MTISGLGTGGYARLAEPDDNDFSAATLPTTAMRDMQRPGGLGSAPNRPVESATRRRINLFELRLPGLTPLVSVGRTTTVAKTHADATDAQARTA